MYSSSNSQVNCNKVKIVSFIIQIIKLLDSAVIHITRYNYICCGHWIPNRLRVVPHFSSGIIEQASARENHPTREKATIFLSPRRVSPFLAWGDFHARSRFARSTIPEEKWGTTRSLDS